MKKRGKTFYRSQSMSKFVKKTKSGDGEFDGLGRQSLEGRYSFHHTFI